MIKSKNVVRLRRAIKTETRFFIIMDLCNCSDLKELVDSRDYKLNLEVI